MAFTGQALSCSTPTALPMYLQAEFGRSDQAHAGAAKARLDKAIDLPHVCECLHTCQPTNGVPIIYTIQQEFPVTDLVWVSRRQVVSDQS